MPKYIILAIGNFLTILPRSLQSLVGKALGLFVFFALKRRREICIYNLRVTGFKEPKKLALACFMHHGQSLVDTLLLLNYEKALKPYLIFEDKTTLLDNKTGVVMLTGHIGNWEVLGSYANLGAKIFGLYRPQKKKWADELLKALRFATGMQLLSTHNSLKEAYLTLKEGNILGNVGDQGRGLELAFFGIKTQFPEGPMRLAYKTNSKVLFYACIREGLYLRLFKVSEISVQNLEYAKYMQVFISDLEKLILKYPEQYFWLHDIFRKFKRKK